MHGIALLEEEDMEPDKDYEKLVEVIRKPRQAILTRLEFIMLVKLYELNRAVRQAELQQAVVLSQYTASSANMTPQLTALRELGLVESEEIQGVNWWTLTNKGQLALIHAAALLNAMGG